jgi:hypothetical protein
LALLPHDAKTVANATIENILFISVNKFNL